MQALARYFILFFTVNTQEIPSLNGLNNLTQLLYSLYTCRLQYVDYVLFEIQVRYIKYSRQQNSKSWVRSPIRAPPVIIQHKKKKKKIPQIKSLPPPIFLIALFLLLIRSWAGQALTNCLPVVALTCLLAVVAGVEMFAPLCMWVFPTLQFLSRSNLYAGAFQVVSWEYRYSSFLLI